MKKIKVKFNCEQCGQKTQMTQKMIDKHGKICANCHRLLINFERYGKYNPATDGSFSKKIFQETQGSTTIRKE